MAKSPIKPRRPVAWNTLLRKGHAHERSRSADRSDERRTLEDEVDDYLAAEDDDAHAACNSAESKKPADPGRQPAPDQGSKDPQDH